MPVKYFLLSLVVALICLMPVQKVQAQNSPFAQPGVSQHQRQPQSNPSSRLNNLLAYIYQKQREFQQRLTASLKRLKQNNAVIWVLLGISFLYGIFHAAGPGHGKMVLSSYMLASNTAARRGIAMAFAAAFVQAIVAILLVGVLATAIHATGVTISRTIVNIESGSYALIILFGLYLLWSKLKRFLKQNPAASDGEGPHHHHDDHDDCGHAHAPDPRQLEGDLPLLKAAGLVIAMGIRPCTGAVLVLLFALSQGIVWAGVAATFAMAFGTALTVSTLAMAALGSKRLVMHVSSRNEVLAARIHQGLEILGAALILVLGVILLMASFSRGSFF